MGVPAHCACHCKDTHFEAIHNRSWTRCLTVMIVLATAKIHILKQFTTEKFHYHGSVDCACHCKDTHFEAIHNVFPAPYGDPYIVLATAKIHILKQFTTDVRAFQDVRELCLPLQRYTF